MKKTLILMLATLLLCVCFCACMGPEPDNLPYEPDTPAPAAHDGLFTSDHGSLRFNGDGETVEVSLDGELARRTGLPEGEHRGTYVFLSGNLPPHGSLPVRYDTAHELQITLEGQSAVIDLGIAAKDGKSGQVGVNVVTPERIPMLFYEENLWFHIMFVKEES